jgi:hypothetical protein
LDLNLMRCSPQNKGNKTKLVLHQNPLRVY